MADTAISALTAASTLTGTEEIPLSDGTATTKAATTAQIKDFVENAPVFAAGSASAGTWPVFTAGTVMTTPEDGAIEFDGNNFFATTDAGNRGYIPVRHFIRADATRTFTSNTTEQAIFTNPTNGRLTLETGTYLFEGVINVGTLSATSGNAAIDILGAGTATIGAWLWHAVGVDGNTATAATQTGSTTVTQQSAASIVTAGTGTVMTVNLRGTFEVTGAGTIIPSLTMVTASASVVAIGSYILFERMSGSTSAVSLGQWD